LDNITFVENLSHKLVIAYAQGTGDEEPAVHEEDSGWEVYFVNKYMIYENLAAINELGYFRAPAKFMKTPTATTWMLPTSPPSASSTSSNSGFHT
jgi:hypothetical protein